ncbi:MAG: carbamoyltransferase HypF [Cyanobacteria bacterium Co-bin13]|nr:carbamoyltransferase HypF [Cyanobacteria bacterium Co-bin13]
MSIFPFTSQYGADSLKAEQIRVQGSVHEVAFGPIVYRLAKQRGLRGEVCSDGTRVDIIVVGEQRAIDALVVDLRSQAPFPTAIKTITRTAYAGKLTFSDFNIISRQPSPLQALMLPDTATCLDCQREIFDPLSRYYRYPFTSCAGCGPRLSILQMVPAARPQTSLAAFPLCADCQQEAQDVNGRRFQSLAAACPQCGPQVRLAHPDGSPVDTSRLSSLDNLDAVATLLLQGDIVAIKGLSGVQLACDATNEVAVRRLRQHSSGRPLTLMARDLPVVERYCQVSPEEKALLQSSAAPAVLLPSKLGQLPGFWLEAEFLSFHRGDFADQIPSSWEVEDPEPALTSEAAASDQPFERSQPSPSSALRPIAPSVAPGHRRLGFMLPYTPLHHLMLQRLDRPIVLTSDSPADLPTDLGSEAAKAQLALLADYVLLNDLDIVNPAPDSVVQVSEGQLQVLQRGRGYVLCPIYLPEGFEQSPALLALGDDHNNTLCRLQDGQALLSQPIRNLKAGKSYQTYQQTLDQFGQIFAAQPEIVAVDQQPDYRSTQLGLSLSQRSHEGAAGALRLHSIQHHHAHVAACMAENGLPLKTPPVLGIALDGLGFGDDGTLWGGEFLLADYRGYRRLATFKPVALFGGEQAIYQPWRSTYAHFRGAFDWAELLTACGELELIEFLLSQPQVPPEMMLNQDLEVVYSPLASSAGRLFDAVAAAVGICRETASYEGQGAVELEALIEPDHLPRTVPYPFEAVARPEDGLWLLDPRSMWLSLLADLMQNVDAAVISARFHVGLAAAIAALTHTLQDEHPFTLVALTGGVFQNQILALEVKQRLEDLGLTVLTHSKVPPNNGGLSLGQAVIAAARHLSPEG